LEHPALVLLYPIVFLNQHLFSRITILAPQK
jgi:hypothetical protein